MSGINNFATAGTANNANNIIFTSLIDVIKQTIPMIVNTTNQSLNYAIIGFIVAMINYLYFGINYKNVFIFNKKLNKGIVNLKNEDEFKETIRTTILMNSSFNQNDPITYSIMFFLVKHFQYKIEKFCLSKDDQKNDIIIPKSNILYDYVHFIKPNEIFPLYYSNNEIIGISKNESHVYLVYSTNTIYNEFLNMIEQYKKPIEISTDVVTTNNQIILRDTNNPSLQYRFDIYSDRDMNSIVSKHKHLIEKHLDKFIQASTLGVSSFNGFGSYNLGIMLYGLHGCGKTSLAKAICNKLNRTAMIVNMRQIKTCSDFRKLFYSQSGIDNTYYKKYVYILDEVDCVDSVLSRENDTKKSTDIDDDKILSQLREKHMELLKTLGKDNEAVVKAEIEKVSTEIQNHNQRLSLYTLLTELDGIAEMRGRVIIANTNYLNRIDSALLREGRFDLKIELTNFMNDEIREILVKMYQPEFKEIIHSATFPDNVWSPAKIRNICHQYESNDIEGVIKHLCEAK